MGWNHIAVITNIWGTHSLQKIHDMTFLLIESLPDKFWSRFSKSESILEQFINRIKGETNLNLFAQF